ncbi:MAG TPA: hypothetical protein PKZ12_02945 [Smithellaceae bacterium]|nr:hypothetical protein [Smithellaceae bacterium]
MATDSIAEEDKKIFELTDVYEERNDRNNQEVIVVDGRGYKRMAKDNKEVYELVDVVEVSQPGQPLNNEQVIKTVREVAERIAREIIPDIAERIIREEIEKIKNINGNDAPGIN